jgi:YfiH family protein
VLRHAPWSGTSGLVHGFLDAGESTPGPWPAALVRVGVTLALATPRQVHGAHVATADAREVPEADALVVAAPGLAVGVVTADCVPILLIDRSRRLAAAVHAGWRGAAAGVIEAAVEHLEHVGGARPAELEAAIGPAIGGCCYEVGPEVRTAFETRTGEATAAAWTLRGGRRFVDLRSAAAALLARAGVTSTVLGPCTACGEGYHSYRRDGAGAGRQLSFVGWNSR